MIGSKLGPYEIRAELGRGGMATVFRAYQPAIDREVAIKVIHPGILTDAHMVDRFRREARMIARLEHPHILPIYDFDGAHSPPYIVMRYLDQGTLRDLIARERLSLTEVVNLIGQVAAALDYAHAQGVVHRDIKPSNVLLDRHGNAFVSDFGIARLIAGAAPTDLITHAGTVVGTPDYMAPEQAMGRTDVDGRADIYALGVMLFQFLTGQLPYYADRPLGVTLKHIKAPIPSVCALNPTLPEQADALIRRAMAKYPSLRFSTASELATQLASLTQFGDSTKMVNLRPAVTVVLDTPSMHAVSLPPTEQQRVISALHVDVSKYRALLETPEGAENDIQALAAFWERATVIIADHGGCLAERSEDDMVAIWGAEQAQEDDAERAVLAALVLRDIVLDFGSQRGYVRAEDVLPVRLAIHTGPALIAHDTTGTLLVTGGALRTLRCLSPYAEGVVLISHDTFRAVRGVFDVAPAEQVWIQEDRDSLLIYHVHQAKSRAFRALTRDIEGVEPPLIGRVIELKRLQDAFLDAVEESESQLVTIVGDVGLGKSRLLDELDRHLDLGSVRCRVFRARATPAMSERPYALLRDLLAFRFEIRDNDPLALALQKLEEGFATLLGAPQVEMAHLIGYLAGFNHRESAYILPLLLNPEVLAARGRQLLITFFTRLSAISPVRIELEDLHYADLPSLDLFGTLVHQAPALQLFVIAAARPMLFERCPSWGQHLAHATRIDLQPLDRRASRELASTLLQRVVDPPKELRDFLVVRAEGVPLFMEELLRTLLDEHVIIKDSNDHWRAELSRLAGMRVPPTLIRLLQTRLDTLLAPERLVLQRASVLGRAFVDAMLSAVDAADTVHVPDLSGVLRSLEQRGLVERRPESSFTGSSEYVFVQTMVRDLLYETLLEGQRRTYHRAAAVWLASGPRAQEHLAFIADHYERAGDNGTAAHWYIRSGSAATERYANDVAISQYRHALMLLPNTLAYSPEALICHSGMGQSYAAMASFVDAVAHLHQACEIARHVGDRHAEARALDRLALIANDRSDPLGRRDYAQQALELARAVHDKPLIVRCLFSLSLASSLLGSAQRGLELSQEALTIARQTTDASSIAKSLSAMGIAYDHLGDTATALRCTKEALDRFRELGDIAEIAAQLNNLGKIANAQGDFASALDFLEEGMQIVRENGLRSREIYLCSNLGTTLVGLEHYTQAEEVAERGIQIAEQSQIKPFSEFYRTISAVRLSQGQGNEAIAVAQHGLDLAREAANPREIGVAWYALGIATAAQPEREGATACFVESMRLLGEVGLLTDIGRVLRAWADYELRSGDAGHGRELLEQARTLFEQAGLAHELGRTPRQSSRW